jgi:hypothetical protein
MRAQVWKLPAGLRVQDLKALLEAAKAEAFPPLPGEVKPQQPQPQQPQQRPPSPALPPQRAQRESMFSMGAGGAKSGKGGSGAGRRFSLLLPGKESPRWLSLQQARCGALPFLPHPHTCSPHVTSAGSKSMSALNPERCAKCLSQQTAS